MSVLPESDDMKAKQRDLVKQLFAEYCSAGTPPNEAAVLAMKKVLSM